MTFFFSCLIALARISNAMLKKSGKTGYTYIVTDLKENAFVFPPLSVLLAMDLSHMASIMLRYVPFLELILESCKFRIVSLLIHVYNIPFLQFRFHVYFYFCFSPLIPYFSRIIGYFKLFVALAVKGAVVH